MSLATEERAGRQPIVRLCSDEEDPLLALGMERKTAEIHVVDFTFSSTTVCENLEDC